jgi:hypothetical protein
MIVLPVSSQLTHQTHNKVQLRSGNGKSSNHCISTGICENSPLINPTTFYLLSLQEPLGLLLEQPLFVLGAIYGISKGRNSSKQPATSGGGCVQGPLT